MSSENELKERPRSRKTRIPKTGITTLGNVVLGTQRRLWHMTPGSGRITRAIDTERYRHQQERLRKLGGLAAIADIQDGPKRITLKSNLDRLLSTLRQARVLGPDNIIGVQPLIFETAFREGHKPLTRNARKLSSTLDAERPKGSTLFNFGEPLTVSGRRGVVHSTYGAIDLAATALHRKAIEEAQDGYVKAPSLIVVASPQLIVRAFERVNHADIHSSGLAVLSITDRLPSRNIWDTHPPLAPELVEAPVEIPARPEYPSEHMDPSIMETVTAGSYAQSTL